MITISIMLATIIQALDGTIANVALPHMQGTFSATPDRQLRAVSPIPVTQILRERHRDRGEYGDRDRYSGSAELITRDDQHTQDAPRSGRDVEPSRRISRRSRHGCRGETRRANPTPRCRDELAGKSKHSAERRTGVDPQLAEG